MRLAGIGVDLVDLKRIRRFLQDHSPKKLRRILTEKEYQVLKRGHFSTALFARFFCAKEAYFKTLGASWLGMEGMASLETNLKSADRFSIQALEGPLALNRAHAAEGCFFKTGNLLGAQVLRWED